MTSEAKSDVTHIRNSPAENVAIVSGRVVEINQHEGDHYHTLQLPAPDVYTNPGWASVKAPYPLAQPGQDWRGKCHITGWRRNFRINQGPRAGQQGHEIKTHFVVIPSSS